MSESHSGQTPSITRTQGQVLLRFVVWDLRVFWVVVLVIDLLGAVTGPVGTSHARIAVALVLLASAMKFSFQYGAMHNGNPEVAARTVHKYLESDNWYKQSIGVKRMSMGFGFRYGLSTIRPSSRRRAVEMWLQWWSRNHGHVQWDDELLAWFTDLE